MKRELLRKAWKMELKILPKEEHHKLRLENVPRQHALGSCLAVTAVSNQFSAEEHQKGLGPGGDLMVVVFVC